MFDLLEGIFNERLHYSLSSFKGVTQLIVHYPTSQELSKIAKALSKSMDEILEKENRLSKDTHALSETTEEMVHRENEILQMLSQFKLQKENLPSEIENVQTNAIDSSA